jgi:D-alanyl-D-alanine carboxypeptidase
VAAQWTLQTLSLIVLVGLLPKALADLSAPGSQSNDLRKKIETIIKSKGFSKSELGLFVSESKEGRLTEVYSLNADKLMIPASLSKIVTAGVALTKMGPDKKFKTQLLINGTPRKGVVDGPLYLKGFGDPGLCFGGYVGFGQ